MGLHYQGDEMLPSNNQSIFKLYPKNKPVSIDGSTGVFCVLRVKLNDYSESYIHRQFYSVRSDTWVGLEDIMSKVEKIEFIENHELLKL